MHYFNVCWIHYVMFTYDNIAKVHGKSWPLKHSVAHTLNLTSLVTWDNRTFTLVALPYEASGSDVWTLTLGIMEGWFVVMAIQSCSIWRHWLEFLIACRWQCEIVFLTFGKLFPFLPLEGQGYWSEHNNRCSNEVHYVWNNVARKAHSRKCLMQMKYKTVNV